MSATPWLSILLPCYKVGAFVRACADSILAQADAGVELVFLDDASPDETGAVLAALQAAHPQQVRVLTQPHNQGISAARNRLLEAARGDYLWYVDPDDLMEPGALAALKAILDTQSPDLVMCDFRTIEEDGSRPAQARQAHVPSFIGPAGPCENRDALLQGLFRAGRFHPWSKIVRRALWPADLRFPVGQVFEDLAVFPRLALQARRFHHVPQVWMAYRQRAGSILASLGPKQLEDWSTALVGYADDIATARPPPSAQSRFEIAHYCARNFIRIAKRSKRLGLWTPDASRRLVARWAASSALSVSELARVYLARGRLWRWLQLRLWLHHMDSSKSS